MNLTRRGRIALSVLIIIVIGVLYWSASNTPDMCLDKRQGYVNCITLDPNYPPSHINP